MGVLTLWENPMSKVLVFHRDNGQHLAIPVMHTTAAVLSLVVGIMAGVMFHWMFGLILTLAFWLVAYYDFKSQLPNLKAEASAEYSRKYGDADYVDEDDLYDGEYVPEPIAEVRPAPEPVAAPERAFYESLDVPEEVSPVAELWKPVEFLTYEEGYDNGYRDGRKRYENIYENTNVGEDTYEHGYCEGYADGRGHKARRYFD